ncbi:hypothetical protein HZC09_06170 [Candidatus Micrarchaeota archaeon]|nr:hypothetical protein [Candidatus Micrarchaeota archaeon]
MRRQVLPELLGTRAKASVLEQILRNPEKKWTGRQLAKQAGISAPQTAEALNAFKARGLVDCVQAGRSTVWSLNPRSPFVGLFSSLFPLSSGTCGEKKYPQELKGQKGKASQSVVKLGLKDLQVRVFREEDGSWAASCSALGVYAVGKNLSEVKKNFAEALDLHLEAIRSNAIASFA